MYTAEQIKEERLDDFRIFLIHFWDHLGLPFPTPVQLDIAYWLQYGPERIVIQAFRGLGKSWITVGFVLWTLFLNPQAKIEVVSAGENLANDFSRFCLRVIREWELLEHLEPRMSQRRSGQAFDVAPATASRDPSVKSVGITGGITGTRADLLVADDIEVPKNSFTLHLRERLAKQVEEFEAILKPGGRIVYLGTPHSEDSLYNRLAKQGYTRQIWPSEVHKKPEVYADELAPFVQRMVDAGLAPQTPTDPDRFDEEELARRRASMGLSGYNLQYLLDTTLADVERFPLKLHDLLVTDVDPDQGHVKLMWSRDRENVIEDLPAGGFVGDHYVRPAHKSDEVARWGGTVMAIDPSGTGKDETAYAVVRQLHSQLYLVDVGGFKDGFGEDTLHGLAAVALKHRVNWVITELNFGGGMFAELLRPMLRSVGLDRDTGERLPAGRIDDEWNGWSRGQKEARILGVLEPLVQAHRLTVDRRVIEEDIKVQQEEPAYSFVHQMTRLENVKGCLQHDDRVEAVSQACAYFVELMNQDRDDAIEKHKDRQKDEVVRAFFGSLTKNLHARIMVPGSEQEPTMWND